MKQTERKRNRWNEVRRRQQWWWTHLSVRTWYSSHEILAFLVFIFIHTTVTIYFDVQAASRKQRFVKWNAKFQ